MILVFYGFLLLVLGLLLLDLTDRLHVAPDRAQWWCPPGPKTRYSSED